VESVLADFGQQSAEADVRLQGWFTTASWQIFLNFLSPRLEPQMHDRPNLSENRPAHFNDSDPAEHK
jgi:hypothetical protein